MQGAVTHIQCSGCDSRGVFLFHRMFIVSSCKTVKQTSRHCIDNYNVLWVSWAWPRIVLIEVVTNILTFWSRFSIICVNSRTKTHRPIGCIHFILMETRAKNMHCDCIWHVSSYITLFNIYKLCTSSVAIFRHHHSGSFHANIVRQENYLYNRRSV